ncbi:MAG: hypothetical protein HWE30_18700 [Methylocystaceae bacterium]|nr:hypothetical protein [Methylocystaceae bacterium]NVK20722.1 hypothetical protein [Methylocystaceae bacterium]
MDDDLVMLTKTVINENGEEEILVVNEEEIFNAIIKNNKIDSVVPIEDVLSGKHKWYED